MTTPFAGQGRALMPLAIVLTTVVVSAAFGVRARAQSAPPNLVANARGNRIGPVALQNCPMPAGSGHASAHQGNPRARAAAQRSLAFLARDTIAWQGQHNCYGCHVQAVTLEALVVGRHHQYEVAQSDLQTVIAGMTTGPGGSRQHGGMGVGASQSMTETASAFAGAAFAHFDEQIGPALRDDLLRVAQDMLQFQAEDGSVRTSDRRFPTEIGEMQSTTQAAMTWRQAHARTADERWLAPIRRAEGYLQGRARGMAEQVPESILDINYAVMGLVASGASATESVVQTLARQLRARQGSDGGWAYRAAESSGAFATGQTLYTLRLIGASDEDAAIARGTSWLLSHQSDDGGWSHAGSNKAEAMWAVLGLVSMDVVSVSVAGVNDGERLQGTSEIRATAQDNLGAGVRQVELVVDDVPIQRACGSSLQYRLDAALLATGIHNIDVVATNARGQMSRRRLEVYAGEYYLTQIGSRFADNGTLLSWRNLAPAATRNNVQVKIFGTREVASRTERTGEVFRTALAGTQGAMSFFWNGSTVAGPAAPHGRYVAELTFLTEPGGARQTVEVPFVHDTLEAQHAAFAEVEGNLSVNGAGSAANTRVDLVDRQGNVVQSVTSTRSGQYRFRNVNGGQYHVRVAREGFAASEAPVTAAPAAASSANIDLRSH